MSESGWEIVFGLVVVIVAVWLPKYLSKHIAHGEARFDKDGKMIEDD